MSISPLFSPVLGMAPAAATSGIAKNFNQFLQLLTTQLKNQDPLSPLDTNQFTNQLVQFSQVEQSIGMNQSLAKLVSAQENSQQRDDIVAGQSLIGKTVDALSERVALKDGQAELFYAVDADASTIRLELLDTFGEIVSVVPGRAAAGIQRFTWDANDVNGNPVQDGVYGLRVVARNADDIPVAAQTGFTAGVSELRNENGQVQILAGQIAVPVSSVVAVRSAETNN